MPHARSAEQIAEVLVGIIRATPGLTADEHIERAVAALGPPATAEALQTLVERTLDHLVEGPLHWLADDVTVAYFDTVTGRTFTRRFIVTRASVQSAINAPSTVDDDGGSTAGRPTRSKNFFVPRTSCAIG